MGLSFIKAQATGNDFIFIFRKDLKEELSPATIEKLCSRRFGIGADGLVLLEPAKEKGDGSADYIWDFYNSDGGRAEMCGNAARCATVILSKELQQEEVTIKTKAGLVKGKINGEGAAVVSFNLPLQTPAEVHSPCGGLASKGYLLNTGVPHCVILINEPWSLQNQSERLAKYIFSPEFGKAGANLTFADWSDPDKIICITLERGVNDFTLSCGTGVIAVGQVHEKLTGHSGWKKVVTPGGELQVRSVSGTVSLSGPAQIVYKGVL